MYCMCVQVPELRLVSAELHVGSKGSVMQSRLSHSERSLFIINGLLQVCDIPLLSPDLLQNLLQTYYREKDT